MVKQTAEQKARKKKLVEKRKMLHYQLEMLQVDRSVYRKAIQACKELRKEIAELEKNEKENTHL